MENQVNTNIAYPIELKELLQPHLIEALREFAWSADFLAKMELSFGRGDYDALQQAWQQGQGIVPELEIRAVAEINRFWEITTANLICQFLRLSIVPTKVTISYQITAERFTTGQRRF